MKSSRRYVFVGMILAFGACGPQEKEPAADTQDSWECVMARDGWEQCDAGSVIWCHAVPHGDYESGHFHEGATCSQDGLACVELDGQTAACADESTSCEAGYAECSERDALNCTEDGVVASMRCSLSEMCQVSESGARCISLEEVSK